MDASGFPPRLDLFKAVAARLVSDDGGPPLGITQLRRFLNTTLSTPRNLPMVEPPACSLQQARTDQGLLQKLQTLLRKYKFLPHNIYNMDEKGFLLGHLVCWAGETAAS